jgi:probable F420-dependent oxidoreductase
LVAAVPPTGERLIGAVSCTTIIVIKTRRIDMLFAAGIFATDYAMRPDDLARELEARGFESLWLPEHTHIPENRRTPYPAGGDLPKEYWHTHDPFVALTAAAMVTSKLRIATGICLIIERDPITTAKEIASLDMLSGGRFIFGIGGGWNAEEMENHGTEFKSRFKRLREQVLAMKEIWTKDEAEYHGKHVSFDKIWSYPKPVQKPYPPILMGGVGPHARQRAAEFDGHWLPLATREPIADGIADLKARAEKVGRDPATVTVSLFGARPDEARLAALREAGVARAIFALPPTGRDTVLPLVDQYASLIQKLA